jgi:hypothetical protein
MVLMWLEAWTGSLGLGRRAPTRLDVGEAILRVPAWRRRSGRPALSQGTGTPGSGVEAAVRSPDRACRVAPVRRPFWVRVDRRIQGHAAIGGSFAEVCAALERLAAAEDGRA